MVRRVSKIIICINHMGDIFSCGFSLVWQFYIYEWIYIEVGILCIVAAEAMLWLFGCKTHGSTCLCVVPLCWHTMSLINYCVATLHKYTQDAGYSSIHNTQTYMQNRHRASTTVTVAVTPPHLTLTQTIQHPSYSEMSWNIYFI